ncbi:GrgA family transcription factor [Chlamydia sp.]|uniref:GrgA family transcription factor n=1 Tax=Chlamydia sp. TaxID=35827 RepID=UPI0025C2BFD2|nr:hypothetical protein [Chlamydia sp.]MBQ8499002.1 hypothetical protein [Chlamydia sp.]
MYFTRDPVIETVITSKEGYKLSVRNSKHLSQDPFIVEAIEVVRLGGTCFFRNCDHSKPFLVPAADYEVMEVRDAKINLKAVGLDRGVKIVSGREALLKMPKVAPITAPSGEDTSSAEEEVSEPAPAAPMSRKERRKEFKSEKWKEKKKQGRRRSSKEIADAVGSSQEMIDTVVEECLQESSSEEGDSTERRFSLIPPPTRLICEGPEQSSEESKPVTSVDLNESLNALVNESSDVIESILADEDTVVFTRENNKKPVQEPQEELPSLSLEVPAHDSVSSEE